MDWLTTLSDTFSSIAPVAADAYSTVKSADALNHQQVAPQGLQYVNGQFSAGSGGISSTMLLIGGAVLLVLFLKD